LWYDRITQRSIAPRDCSVFYNHVDETVFCHPPRTRQDGKFIIIFPGTLQWHQGMDVAVNAFDIIKDKVPNAEFHIYGEGDERANLEALVAKLKLQKRVLFFNDHPLNEIAGIIANADLGVVPKRADGFGNEAYSTKIMEFMLQGVPAVISRTKIDSFYFTDEIVRFFESGNVEDMADAMLTVIRNQPLRETMVEKALRHARENCWGKRESAYLCLIDSLTA